MKRLFTLFVSGLLLLSIHAGEPPKEKSQVPVCKLSGSTLKVTHQGKTETVKNIFVPKNPTQKWDPAELVSPDGKLMVVPMANSTHAYYTFSDEGMELQGYIEGGVSWSASFARGRNRWHFTGWKDVNTLGLIGEKLSAEDFVEAELKFWDDDLSFHTTTEGDGEHSLSLRLVFPDGSGEIPFRYRVPEKEAPKKDPQPSAPTAPPR